MAKVIGIMGESGSGKTTSCRNLDPSTTYYIDCDKKGLNWKGWRDQYNAAANNYKQTNFPSIVLGILKNIEESDKAKHVKTVVIDTINGLMVAVLLVWTRPNTFLPEAAWKKSGRLS